MEYLCDHILDLAENSTAAGAGLVEIRVVEDVPGDRLTIEMKDDGRGLCPDDQRQINGPLDECRVCGLGLTLFSRACQEAGGTMEAQSVEGVGTTLRGAMQLSHPDRQPLGDLGETLITLVMGSPVVNWVVQHEKIRADGVAVSLRVDTREIRGEVGNVSLAHPEIVRRIRVSYRQQESKLKE
jgi:hypothetical protein